MIKTISLSLLLCAYAEQATTSSRAEYVCITDRDTGRCVGEEDLWSCSELGCPYAPSGNPDPYGSWWPCEDFVCYCRIDDGGAVEMVACLA